MDSHEIAVVYCTFTATLLFLGAYCSVIYRRNSTMQKISLHIQRYLVVSFLYFNGTLPYTFVSVNNEAAAHISMWPRALLFRRFTDTNVCTVSVPFMENSPQNISEYTDIFTGLNEPVVAANTAT